MKLEGEKWISKRLVLITGSEDILRRRALTEVLRAAESGPEDFDFEAFSADERPSGDWIASVSTVPFFSPRRTAVVRNVLRIDPKSEKNTAFDRLPETALLILVADDEAGSDENKIRRQETLMKNWAALVTQAKGSVVDCSANQSALPQLIQNDAKLLGKKLSGPAAMALAEMTGGSYSRAAAEIEKLAEYVGDHPEIREADVRTAVAPSREWSIWALVDSISDGSVHEAIRQLRILLGTKSGVENAAMRSILPQLSRHVRLLYQARVCLDLGQRPPAVSPEVRAMLPEKNIADEKPFVVRRITDKAAKLTLEQCAECLAVTADADAKLKGAMPASSGLDTLEILVQRLAEALRPIVRSA